MPAGQAVLEQAARRFGFQLKWRDYDWSCERYAKTGKMMPDDAIDQLRDSDAIYLGAVGYPGVPDHVSLWGLLIPIRRVFDQSSGEISRCAPYSKSCRPPRKSNFTSPTGNLRSTNAC